MTAAEQTRVEAAARALAYKARREHASEEDAKLYAAHYWKQWESSARAALLAADAASPGSEGEWEPDAKMEDYWRDAIGGSYTPVKFGKHESSHPTTVKRVLDSVRGTEAADVIVGLVFWAHIVRNREDELLKLLAASPSPSVTEEEVAKLRDALEESVKLQSHYAGLLNAYDGGERLQFSDGSAWVGRLAIIRG